MDPEPCVTESLHEDPACVGESHGARRHDSRNMRSALDPPYPKSATRGTFTPHASLILSDTHSGTNRDISPRPQRRRSRRLSRHQGRRPLPVARGCGLAGHAQLGRGGESGHLRLSGADPRARADPPTPDRAVGLSEIRRPVQEGRPLFLLQEFRTPEPVGPLHAELVDGRARGPARSEYALVRRDGCALDPRVRGGRADDGVRNVGERLRLAGIPRARCGDAAGPTRSPQVDQVLERGVDARWRRLLL